MKTKIHLYLLIFLFCTGAILALPNLLFAKSPDRSFTIHADLSLISLAEGWIQEFRKIRPDAEVHLMDVREGVDSPKIRLFEHSLQLPENQSGQVNLEVGQIALLPIINERNPHFVKEQKKGVRLNQLKEMFFAAYEESPSRNEPRKEPEYEVYSPVPRSATALAFSAFFERSPEDLNGIYVSGDDSHLIKALIADTAGISYGKLPMIYDPETREPLRGLKVLPLDLNNNGRLDKNEMIYGNLDQILQNTGSSGNPSFPVVRVSLSIHSDNLSNPYVYEFINWIRKEGQLVNAQHGFFMGEVTRSYEYTQNYK